MPARNRAIVGTLVWAGFVFARVGDLRAADWTHALLLFAALVLVPLALELFADPEEPADEQRLWRWARFAQLPAAVLLAIACWMPPGFAASVVALPWAAFTMLLAVLGIHRLRRGGLRRGLDQLCADIALIYVLVGGAWTLADRVGFRPLGFDLTIVALTAVHFHYAGLLLPLFAGLVQRELWFWRFASQAAVGVVLGVPAVAIGITATQLGWKPSIEAAFGCGLALAGMAVAVLHLRIALETRRSLLTRALVGVAGVSLFFGMVLAALYAMRPYVQPFPWLAVPEMRALHGTINAVGFGLCGVLGWRRMLAEPPDRPFAA